MRQNEVRVSVVLSTRNRCEKLRSFLNTMKANVGPGSIPAEVLIIDNNSNDATKDVVTEFASSKSPVVRYLFVSNPGKSRALNAGIHEAKGNIVVFTDDDCIPDSNWLQAIIEEFDGDPKLSVLGGRVERYDERDLPQAILLSRSRALVTHVSQICETPAIIGANMAFTKAALAGAGGFDPFLGPGTLCKADEDIDLIYRSFKKKLKIVYSPRVMVYHNHGRRTELDENRTSYAYALGRGALYFKFMLRLDPRITRIALKELYGLTKTLTKGLLTRRTFAYHRLALPALFLGAVYYCRARLLPKPVTNVMLPECTHAH